MRAGRDEQEVAGDSDAMQTVLAHSESIDPTGNSIRLLLGTVLETAMPLDAAPEGRQLGADEPRE